MAEPTSPVAAPDDKANELAAPGFQFRAAIVEMVQRGGSDLHLKGGRPPTVRVNGTLQVLPLPAVKPEELKALAETLMTPRQLADFAESKEADFGIGVPGIGRFRTAHIKRERIDNFIAWGPDAPHDRFFTRRTGHH